MLISILYKFSMLYNYLQCWFCCIGYRLLHVLVLYMRTWKVWLLHCIVHVQYITSSYILIIYRFVESTVNVPMYAEPSISLSVLGEPQEMEQQQSYHLVHGGPSQELTMRDPDFLDFLDQHCSLQIEGSIERPRMYPHRLHWKENFLLFIF